MRSHAELEQESKGIVWGFKLGACVHAKEHSTTEVWFGFETLAS